jgi:hypothetical protein
VGAPESNAGDDFHFWWAASRTLALIDPGTDLRLINLEGLASVDDPDEAYETVDVSEYIGGTDVATARALVLSQLKYSTRDPGRAWTAARLCDAPGVKVADGAIQFRDEDFETYVRDRVDSADVVMAHSRLADMFVSSRLTDADAAAHVVDHLAAAGRLDELVDLVLVEASPTGIADGLRREQVQARRLDLAARAVAETGDAAAAVRVAARSCDTASRSRTLSRLVESRLDMVARYSDIDLLRSYALRQDRSQWLGPALMRLAAALSRDPERGCGEAQQR